MSSKSAQVAPVTDIIKEVLFMCGNTFGGNNCWWIIILILLFCCCCGGNGLSTGNNCGNAYNNGCCDNDRCGCC